MIDQYINTIICGDNVTTLKLFPDECIDLTVTSPPYDNLRTYNGYSFDFEGIANELFRVTKQGGVVVWVVNDATINGSETLTSFKQAIYFRENCGFNLHDTMIYKKQNPLPINGNRYNSCFEYMFVLSKDKPTTFNPIKERKTWKETRTTKNYSKDKSGVKNYGKVPQTDERTKCNIFEYKVGGGHVTTDDIAYDHPAIFPERLAQDHILSWSNEQDLVLDPFSGSGTTCKMATKLNRKYIGIDCSQEYCNLSQKRIKDFTDQGKLF